jgi:hypothetical protein
MVAAGGVEEGPVGGGLEGVEAAGAAAVSKAARSGRKFMVEMRFASRIEISFTGGRYGVGAGAGRAVEEVAVGCASGSGALWRPRNGTKSAVSRTSDTSSRCCIHSSSSRRLCSRNSAQKRHSITQRKAWREKKNKERRNRCGDCILPRERSSDAKKMQQITLLRIAYQLFGRNSRKLYIGMLLF